MSAYQQQEYDFINRTKDLLKQYENFKIKDKEKYEVTLLLNCFVGLLIMPQQYWVDHLPSDLTSEKEWGIKPEHISIIENGKTENPGKNIKSIVRHLRNSVSHYNFNVFSNQQNNISKIQFKDKRGDTITFEASIPLGNLRSFMDKFSSYMLKVMEENN